MIKNKDEIIEDVLSKFEIKHRGVHTETQHFKCVRDTGYNLNAIESDLETGGIRNTLEVAKQYWQGTKSQLGKGEQNYAVEVNNLLEQRLHKEDIDKAKVSLLINVMNEIVQYGFERNFGFGNDMENRIKNVFYEWDRERDLILKIQKCQRNWDYEKFDYNKVFYKECVHQLLWVAKNSPTKQHEGYFDIYWTVDRKLIQELSRYTWGYTAQRTPPATWRNSQSNANMYFVWVAKEPTTTLNCHADGSTKENTDKNRWQNAYCSIGLSIGLTLRAAASMGFSTGCNKSHNDLDGDDYWEKKLGILEDVKAGKKQICYGMGIGYPQAGRPRWESDEVELAIGAANGSKLTTTEQEKHPRTGLKMRKIKIVNIINDGGKKIEDPYGNIHTIPNKVELKVNSFRDRGIEVTEIK